MPQPQGASTASEYGEVVHPKAVSVNWSIYHIKKWAE